MSDADAPKVQFLFDFGSPAVVGRNVEGNEEVVAFVQLLPGARIEAAELKSYSAALLTSYKRPGEIVFLDALPAASTGKILKHKLRELANRSKIDPAAAAG